MQKWLFLKSHVPPRSENWFGNNFASIFFNFKFSQLLSEIRKALEERISLVIDVLVFSLRNAIGIIMSS